VKHFIVALIAAAVGFSCLAWGKVASDLAEAERQTARLEYAGVAETLTRAERFFEYLSRVPFIGNGPLNEVRARRAAVHYWQQDYDSIIPAAPDPIGALPPDNVDLQFIVANAIFRKGQLEAGIAAQLAVLKNSERNEDAAFNYEYLLRLRSGVLLKRTGQGGADEVGDEKTTHGQPGGAPRESDPSDFKIHIPLESREFENQKDGQQAGKAAARKRRG
jgi:hypothetical protein